MLRLPLTLGVMALSLGACAGGEPAPTFAEVRDDIFVPSCGFGTCHGSAAGGLQLDGDSVAADLIGAPSRGAAGEILVVVGDPDNSYLIKKLEDAGIEGDPMPPGAPLAADRIEVVRAWIAGGALD